MGRIRSSVGVLQDGGCIQPGLLLQSKNTSAQHIRRGKWYIAAKNDSCLSKNVPGNYNATNSIVPLYIIIIFLAFCQSTLIFVAI